jgi:putative acetyltransferase
MQPPQRTLSLFWRLHLDKDETANMIALSALRSWTYRDVLIRSWQPADRLGAAQVIQQCLQEYGLAWEPEGADRDVLAIEDFYQQGEFWVVEKSGRIMGTGAYYPAHRGERSVELRKMYLLPELRGQGIGSFLLTTLEVSIAQRGFQAIWLETASVLTSGILLYEKHGYQQACGVETPRCDRIYVKYLHTPR